MTSDSPRFHRGDTVVREGSPDVLGQIIEDPVRDGGEWWYTVEFGRKREELSEPEIETSPDRGQSVEDLAMEGRWGRFEAYLRGMAVERVTRQNRSTVYSFNANRIQFMPHQYRPLLKVLDSEDRRLLIADEVGLGKTIEAGLILTEFLARQKMDRVLVICPSRLRQKWQEEMQRKFHLNFDIWDGNKIREISQRFENGGYVPKFNAIASIQMLRSTRILDPLLSALSELDFLIFDEAHHARNRSTATSSMVEELGTISDGFVMLSATPLHLGSQDLFNLLRLLRPSEFRDEFAFQRSLDRNRGVVTAQSACRARDRDLLRNATEEIRLLHQVSKGENSEDPVLQGVLDLADAIPSSGDEWAELEQSLERAHAISHIFTRSKKRDVYEKAPVRIGKWIHVDWTKEEDDAYLQLAGLDPVSRVPHGRLALGQIQRARQAASSVAATYRYRAAIGSVEEQSDLAEDEIDSIVTPVLSGEPKVDSKYAKLEEVLEEIWADNPQRKVIIFTFFVGTSKYLEQRLMQKDIKVARIAGDIPSNPFNPSRDERARVIDRFREDDDVKVLVSTEVGSEGLDFQFCSVVVNYDLPWNPMVVEQRIGRIDRFGQKAERLGIYSLVVRNTIEDKILERLYDRIGIFSESIGDLETILGDELNEIRREYFSGQLTAAEIEEKADRAARAIHGRAREARQLEEKAAALVGHEDFIRQEVTRVRRLGRFLTSAQIKAIVHGYLERNHPEVRIQEPEEGVWKIRLTDRLLEDIDGAAASDRRWSVELRARSRDGVLALTTDGERAYRDTSLDLLNATHPLVIAGAGRLRSLLDEAGSRVAALRIRRSSDPEHVLKRGEYFLTIFAFDVTGLRERRILNSFLVDAETGEILDGDEAERFGFLSLEMGEEHPDVASLPKLSRDAWELTRSAARACKVRLEEAERRESESMYQRRLLRFIDERDRKLKRIDARVRTMEDRGRSAQVIAASRAQRGPVLSEFKQRKESLEESRSARVSLIGPPIACCVVEVI